MLAAAKKGGVEAAVAPWAGVRENPAPPRQAHMARPRCTTAAEARDGQKERGDVPPAAHARARATLLVDLAVADKRIETRYSGTTGDHIGPQRV